MTVAEELAANVGPATPPIRRLHALAVLVAALAVYGNTLAFGFVWDDAHHVLENVAVRDLANVPRMFTTDVWSGGTRDVDAAPYYRPLFQVSLAVDHAIWGDRPFGYHLTNVLLHALASLLVWTIATRLLSSATGALAAGLLFAVHPVHVEAVAWISARNEAMCAILALESFRRHLRHAELRRRRDLALSLAALFLSLLAKEMSVAIPAIVFVHELALRNESPRRALRSAVPFVVVVLGYLAVRAAVLDVRQWDGSPLAHRALTSFGLVLEYLRLLVAPIGLKVFHDVPVQTRFFTLHVVGPLLALVVIAAAVPMAWRRERRVFFGLAWTGLALLPVSGIPAELAPALMAERYLYFPSIGFVLAAGALVAAAARRMAAGTSQRGAALGGGVFGLGCAVLVAMAVATVAQNGEWRDDETFARAWVRDAPRQSAGHVWLAGAHAGAGRLDDAERQYLEAIRLQPRSVEAHVNLANLYDQIGRVDSAEAHYGMAFQLAPRDPEVLYNIAVHLLGQNRIDEAEPLLRSVVELNGSSCDAHYNLGLIHLARGDRVRAVAHLEQAARIAPDDERYRATLSSVLAR